jgi:hypothetical protein
VELTKVANNTAYGAWPPDLPVAFGIGGGVRIAKSNGSIKSCTISENEGTGLEVDGVASVEESTVSGNLDGAIVVAPSMAETSQLSAVNCTISGNEYAGVRIIGAGAALLNHCTLHGNDVGIIADPETPVEMVNSIVTDKGVVYVGDDPPDYSLHSLGYNLIEHPKTYHLTGNMTGCILNQDAKLALLDFYGGPTRTHALQAGSPALDAASDRACLPTDQRGVARPISYACDMGACEGALPQPLKPFVDGPAPYFIVCDPLAGELSLAIKSDGGFDAQRIAVESVRLEAAGATTSRLTDVDRDGDLDLALTFSLANVYRQLDCATTTSLTLTGQTQDSQRFEVAVGVQPAR